MLPEFEHEVDGRPMRVECLSYYPPQRGIREHGVQMEPDGEADIDYVLRDLDGLLDEAATDAAHLDPRTDWDVRVAITDRLEKQDKGIRHDYRTVGEQEGGVRRH